MIRSRYLRMTIIAASVVTVLYIVLMWHLPSSSTDDKAIVLAAARETVQKHWEHPGKPFSSNGNDTSMNGNNKHPLLVEDDEPQIDKKRKAELEYREPESDFPSSRVHIFYYAWYGSPEVDGRYIHWNHKILQHWKPEEAKKWPQGEHVPPDDIGSNFYPQLGCYSSANRTVVDLHMRQISSSGIGVVVVSWYPPGLSDPNGAPVDSLIPSIMDSAAKYNVKVAFHIEPFENRNPRNLRGHIRYIIDTYGEHQAFYRFRHKGRYLPLFYVYDSYLSSPYHWRILLGLHGRLSVRRTEYDAVFIGLLVNKNDKNVILSAGFDGYYTYFASNTFSYGSVPTNWQQLQSFADQHNLYFIPSVGPGYEDTAIRPWNYRVSQGRASGTYYSQQWETAVEVKPVIVSITSFNEWGEGTQIEPAVPKSTRSTTNKMSYFDYAPHSPNFYLNATTDLVKKFIKSWKT